MLTCLIWIILAVIIAGVLVWALTQLPLDATIVSIGRVVIIVLFVIVVIVLVMNCLGVSTGFPHHPLTR